MSTGISILGLPLDICKDNYRFFQLSLQKERNKIIKKFQFNSVIQAFNDLELIHVSIYMGMPLR